MMEPCSVIAFFAAPSISFSFLTKRICIRHILSHSFADVLAGRRNILKLVHVICRNFILAFIIVM